MGFRPSRQTVRKRLLHSAQQVIDQQGVASFRFTDIATHAEVSKGTLYSHFASKDNLLISMYIERLKDCVEARRELLQSSLRPLERILVANLVPVLISQHYLKTDGLNFSVCNAGLWQYADAAFQSQLAREFEEFLDLSDQLWRLPKQNQQLLSDEEAISQCRHLLLSYQRGCVLQAQNPLLRELGQLPSGKLVYQTMLSMVLQLQWTEEAAEVDREQIFTAARSLLDWHQKALI